MKKSLLLVCSVAFLISCNHTKKEINETDNPVAAISKADMTDVSSKTFDELFTSVAATDVKDNVFKLVGEDFTVITSGDEIACNSMTASYGGWGQLFDLPVTWCILRANRYTLEIIREQQTYTMSYFYEDYKDQVMLFGTKSGRDSDKMNETTLTRVATPSGNITYKEAFLVIECKLMEITTVNPDDYYFEKGRKFVEEAYEDAKDYHKLVFGEITNVWVRK